MDKITVGIFWICDEGGYLDIVYDTEQYAPDWRSDFGDEFIVYENGKFIFKSINGNVLNEFNM